MKEIIDQTDINSIRSKVAELESMKESKSHLRVKKSNTVNKEIREKEKDVTSVAYGWVDPECNHHARLSLYGNRIATKKEANVFGTKRMTTNSSFSIIISCLHSYIGVGVANANYKSSPRLGPDILKYGSNKSIFDGKDELSNQGTGFKEGDRVTVLIKNGLI